MLGNIHTDIIDFIYPRICIVSKERIPEGNSNNYVRDEVLSSIPLPTEEDKREFKLKIAAIHTHSMYAFNNSPELQEIIHSIKYKNMKKLGVFMGRMLGKDLKNKFMRTVYQFDYIVPVPLYTSKERERGYNQSYFICKGIQKEIELEINDNMLQRTKHTNTQAKLNKEERVENVKGAFGFNPAYKYDLTGKNIMLIDDVMTTGATINEAISVLKTAGVNKIFAVTLALANLDR